MNPSATTVFVGGVSELFQGDLDLGRRIVEALSRQDLGHGVLVEDLHYGAVAVAQRLAEADPDALVLVGAERRGRPPGTVERRLPRPSVADPQTAVAEAVQGYVSIALVVDVAAALGVLPARVVAIEVEPATTDTSTELSNAGSRAMHEALALVGEEVRRTPLHVLASEVRRELGRADLGPSRALTAMHALLDELDRMDRDGRWGRVFVERDRLRAAIGAGLPAEGMTHLDWGLWWALIEELDRVQRIEATTPTGPQPSSSAPRS